MKTVTEKKVTEEKPQLVALVSGVAIAYAITCIVFIGYAILLRYSSVSEESIPLVVTITSVVSVIFAGFDAAKGSKNRGWLWGIIAGFLYAVILVAMGFFVNKNYAFDASSITLIILSIAGGGLGGVIGINLKRQ